MFTNLNNILEDNLYIYYIYILKEILYIFIYLFVNWFTPQLLLKR